MAIGQITITDLNDTGAGSLSLDSNHPRIQTYDPNTKRYSPDYEVEPVLITPQFMLGNTPITVSGSRINYTINGNSVIDENDAGFDAETAIFWTSLKENQKILNIRQNLTLEYYHIEAIVSGITQGDVVLPNFTASYDISRLDGGSKVSQIEFNTKSNGWVIKREGNVYDPNYLTFTVDLSSFDFGDLSSVYAVFYVEEEAFYTELNPNAPLEIKASSPYGEYALTNFEGAGIMFGSYMVTLFDRAVISTQANDLESAYTNVNLLNDGSNGKDAYTVLISDNRPVVVCSEKDEVFTPIEDGITTCNISILDGKGTALEITAHSLQGGITEENGLTFTSSRTTNKKSINVEISWQKTVPIKTTTKTYSITFKNGATSTSTSSILASITVLALTGGKNGENGEDAAFLLLEPDPCDQFTSTNTAAINIVPYIYVGSELFYTPPEDTLSQNDAVKFSWVTAGTEEVEPFNGQIYTVSKKDVQTLETYICEVSFTDKRGKERTLSSQITIKNTLYPYYCQVQSSAGTAIKNGKVSTKLTCVVYHSEEGIVVPQNATYSWYYIDKDNNTVGISSGPDNYLNYSDTFQGVRTIYCDVDF